MVPAAAWAVRNTVPNTKPPVVVPNKPPVETADGGVAALPNGPRVDGAAGTFDTRHILSSPVLKDHEAHTYVTSKLLLLLGQLGFGISKLFLYKT